MSKHTRKTTRLTVCRKHGTTYHTEPRKSRETFYRCDSCGREAANFVYHCDFCGADLCSSCRYIWPGESDPLHEDEDDWYTYCQNCMEARTQIEDQIQAAHGRLQDELQRLRDGLCRKTPSTVKNSRR